MTVQDLMKERSEAVTKEYNMEANGWITEGTVDCDESRQLAFVWHIKENEGWPGYVPSPQGIVIIIMYKSLLLDKSILCAH